MQPSVSLLLSASTSLAVLLLTALRYSSSLVNLVTLTVNMATYARTVPSKKVQFELFSECMNVVCALDAFRLCLRVLSDCAFSVARASGVASCSTVHVFNTSEHSCAPKQQNTDEHHSIACVHLCALCSRKTFRIGMQLQLIVQPPIDSYLMLASSMHPHSANEH
jgi:hypothetical protein